MIRIKHIGADGAVKKTIDITPETSDKDLKAALAEVKTFHDDDIASGNTLGIVAKPIDHTNPEVEAEIAKADKI